MVTEKPFRPLNGWLPLIIVIALLIAGPWQAIAGAIGLGATGSFTSLAQMIAGIVLFALGFIALIGFQAIAPNQARVYLLFGVYKGSALESGFFWVNPFYSKKKISLRVRNFETGSIHTPEKKNAAGEVTQHAAKTAGRPSKVNDRDGNPIEISAVVVWKVVNTAEALFEVDDFEDFVAVQSEAALELLSRLREKLGIRRAVTLKSSPQVYAPIGLGVFSPTIILPDDVMDGGPVEELEMILAHELAHIKRLDYLVRFLQNVLKVFFFFHPLSFLFHSLLLFRFSLTSFFFHLLLGRFFLTAPFCFHPLPFFLHASPVFLFLTAPFFRHSLSFLLHAPLLFLLHP